MPNIEIHGLEHDKAEILRGWFFEAFSSEPYVDDMVVTIYSTEVVGRNGVKQPFLRLVSTKKADETEEIVAGLKVLNMDIERVELAEFIPKLK